jgi:hypothetical protein
MYYGQGLHNKIVITSYKQNNKNTKKHVDLISDEFSFDSTLDTKSQYNQASNETVCHLD